MQKNEEKKHIEEIKKIFSSVVLLAPFAYPILGYPIVIRYKKAPIAATNGVTIFINIDKWDELNFNNKMFIAMHEWMHIAFLHMKRIRTRNRITYNYACDFNINYLIKHSFSNFDMPTGLYDKNYGEKSSEEIYKDLDSEVKRRIEQNIKPYCPRCKRELKAEHYLIEYPENVPLCPVCSLPLEDPNLAKRDNEEVYIDREAAINQLMLEHNDGICPFSWGNDILSLPEGADEQKILDEVIRAAAKFKSMKRGTLPGSYEDYINEIKKSEVPFERILIRLAKESLKGNVDRNPYRPDPKYLPFDIFVPTEQGRSISSIVLIVDTSRSMDTEEFKFAAGHLSKLNSYCDKLILITADTKVQEVIRIKNIRHELKNKSLKFKGRGGTDMHEAFKRADELRPKLIILYSDMMIGSYPEKPKAPVIFLVREHWAKTAAPPTYGRFLIVKDRNDD